MVNVSKGKRGKFMSHGETTPAKRRALTSAQKTFMESQNHCALCNELLEIQVESYLEDHYLREEAKCPNCKIKTRVKNHKMQ